MRFKGTAVLFLLLAALVGWVYWTEIRGREERERAAEAAGKALPVEAAEIDEISLVYPDGTTLTARRTGSGWEFVTPEGLEADSGAWDSMAANVGRVERDETVVAEPADVAQYGLDSPAVRVQVRMAGGRSEEIRFGAENPAGTFHYTSLASSPEVFLTASTWPGLFRKEADDLRDKTLLHFDQAEIDRIEMRPSGVTLRKEADGWFIEGPPRLRADDTEVASLLGILQSTRATGFGEAAGAGPDVPEAEVALYDEGTDRRHVLAFGRPVEANPDLLYARDDSRDPVFTVGTAIRDRLFHPASYWRDKTIVGIDPDSIVRIEIGRPGQTPLRLQKSGDAWTLPDGREVSDTRIADMLNAFDFQEASEVFDTPEPLGAYGLDRPRLEVVLGDEGQDIHRFGFGDERAGTDQVYWKAEGETAVKAVPRAVMAPFDIADEDLLEAQPEG